jgi:diguanylate cyclase (GGDEF)-like protein
MSERILVADDDPDIRKFIEVTLNLEGFDLISAADGEEAFVQAVEDPPDLVLLDVMMPKLDGFEVCRRLRADPRTSNISVILLTAKSLTADRVVGLTAGADDYIIKPFDPIELVARVKSTLRRARTMRDVNPLTGLPGNIAILRELQARIEKGAVFALMHVDLDNFKAFNDYYGFMRGDEAIKLTARLLQEATLRFDIEESFIGHIGGDDFAVLCSAVAAEAIAKEMLSRFDATIAELYDPEDRAKGYITIADRRDEVHQFPIMTVSIGIATNSHREIGSHWQASEIASEMKQFAKREAKSHYSIDRRGSTDR